MSQTNKKLSNFNAIPFTNITITDKFWKHRIEINQDISLPLQYKQLLKSGVIDNFKKAINHEHNKYNGLFFSDSDLYKWIEAVCYSLKTQKNPNLEILLNEAIDIITKTQEPDGYINTYFQIMEPDKKLTNFGVCHELYTGGHLILAGIAHHKLKSNSKLHVTACRFADHINDILGEEKLKAVDGHAGIELALIELYKTVKNIKYLNLAKFFINQRGNPNSRLRWELNHLEEIAGNLGNPGRNNKKKYGSFENYNGCYAQDHLPVRKQTEAVGHAVRAMYLYCSMADLYTEIGDKKLLIALKKIWQNIVEKKMYITGGIGSSILNEGFTRNYDLPNENACAETCAAYGMIIWSKKMQDITGNSKYADIIERILYNAFLVGVSLDGKKYSYNNPLKTKGNNNRDYWNECACCPPNVAKLITTLGNFIYSKHKSGIVINQYIQSKMDFHLSDDSIIFINMKSNFPWDGKVEIFTQTDKPIFFSFSFRIPIWSKEYKININNKQIKCSLKNGYIKIKRKWKNNDCIKLELQMNTACIISHPLIIENQGKVAIQRGPLIYCLEETDHDVPVNQIIIPDKCNFKENFIPELLGGINVIEGNGFFHKIEDWNNKLYKERNIRPSLFKIKYKAIPYYAWGNRKQGAMIVWLNSQELFL